MEPLEVLAVLGVVGRPGEADARGRFGPVDGHDVLRNGARFGQANWWVDIGVAEVRGGAERAEFFELGRCESCLGIALVDVQVVGNAELLLAC